MPHFKEGDCLRIGPEDVVVKRFISSGQQADVYRVLSVKRNKVMVMKHLYGNYAQNPNLFYEKIKLLCGHRVPHKTMVWPRAISPMDPATNSFAYLMDLVPGTYKPVSLVMKKPDLLTEQQKKQLITQLAEAFSVLHKSQLIYGDISGTNILYKIDRKGNLSIRIIDCDNVSISGQSLGLQGTGLFRAPELLLGEKPTTESDSHALAVAAFRVLIGCHPLDGRYTHSLAFTPQMVTECFGRNPEYIFSTSNRNGPVLPVYQKRYQSLSHAMKLYFDLMFCPSCLHGSGDRPDAAMLLQMLSM